MNTRNEIVFAASSKILLTTLLFALALAPTTHAATNFVTSIADSGAGSLRTVISNSVSGDVIKFNAGLSGQTILLTNGQITVSNSLTIDASALAAGIGISGNTNSRVFQVTSTATVLLSSLTIRDGVAASQGGGGIRNEGTLTMTNCTLTGNSSVPGNGGAIANNGSLTLTGCTFFNNTANFAGAVDNRSTCAAQNCTFYGNSAVAGNGGAIDSAYSATLSLQQCTFYGNSATGYGDDVDNYLSTLNIQNTIMAAGSTPQDIYNWAGSTINASGSNIVQVLFNAGVVNGGNTIVSVDPLLAALGHYGGPTRTMPPLPGSPAIDSGSDSAAGSLATDQRGYPRLSGAHVDIGAVEVASVVTSLTDNGTNSLRQIILGSTPGATITFAPGLSGQTILLTSGQITVSNSLTIDASALLAGIAINGNTNGRIFEFATGTTNVLDSLTLTNARASGTFPAFRGGAIRVSSNAKLTIQNATLTGNRADGNGGAIWNNAGTLAIYNSTLSSNAAASDGGGIQQDGNGTLTIQNSTISGNSANSGGGILHDVSGTLTIQNSTLSGNSALYGGGIRNDGTARIENSTLSGNTAGVSGGGIYQSSLGSLVLDGCTISGNSATGGSGQGGGVRRAGGTVTVTNCIVAGNTANTGGDLSGPITTTGPNLIGGSPLLAPLGDYGGSTQTMPPLPGSPAIDGATNGSSYVVDQRGFARLFGSAVDIGAVELQATEAFYNPVLSLADSGPYTLRAAVASVSPGSTITFGPGLSGQTILLTSGQITLNKNLTIDASGLPAGIVINGNANGRVFQVFPGATVVLDSLTITNGNVSGSGGGINNLGALTVSRCTLAGNTASNIGGGMLNGIGGTLTVNQCTLTANSCAGSGGAGIDNGVPGPVMVNQSTLTGNTTTNSLGSGGIWGTATLFNSIVAGNTAPTYTNTRFAITLTGVNLTNGVPLLAPLGNYGGPTKTMPPLPGSPAIDAADDAAAGIFTFDQRGPGFPRVSGDHVDIGAVELQLITGSTPVEITDLLSLGDGTFQFGFTNDIGASFRVLATTNVALPATNWLFLGFATETPPSSGQFQFTDPDATNYNQRFYSVKSP